MQCVPCQSERSGTLGVKAGRDRQVRQLYRCGATDDGARRAVARIVQATFT
ncbi:MAG: hypothetical protein NVSMB42_09390 [Herpetosiphon sp.]